MRREAGFPVARSWLLIPADLDLVADLRGLLARDVPWAFGFALLVRETSYERLSAKSRFAGTSSFLKWLGGLQSEIETYTDT
jgi:hypothetical protein